MTDWHQSQRGYFAGALLDAMDKDDKIYLLTGDLGFGMFDKIQAKHPTRFINCGASEQAMLGIAVGLALEGKKPFVYTITGFYLRAAETLSLYIDQESVPVRLVGGGRDDDYAHDGISHYAYKAQEFIKLMNIQEYYPENKEEVVGMVEEMVASKKPSFLSLRR